MPVHMAADVDCDRKAGNMRGICLDLNGKRCNRAPKATWTDPKIINLLQ